MLKKLEIYELSMLFRTGEIEALAFVQLEHEAGGLETVIKFREGVEQTLKGFDARWIVLCEDNIFELTEWASRMCFVQSKLNELDRYLAVAKAHPKLFNWQTVASCMGFINAFRVAVEQVLDHSERNQAA